MKLLAIECSAGPASAAIIDDEKIIASSFINVKLTHSQTIMPMIRSMLTSSLTDISEIEGIAVSAGPGSFTGIRIGISAAKGIATPDKLPCAAISTLFGMAQSFKGQDCIVCAVMDARCNQVYNALFKIDGNTITRLCDDRALMCDELIAELKAITNENIVVCGDGADMFYPMVKDINNVCLAPQHLKYQNAVGIAIAGIEQFKNNNTISSDELLPIYLRLPQAERELKAKQENK